MQIAKKALNLYRNQKTKILTKNSKIMDFNSTIKQIERKIENWKGQLKMMEGVLSGYNFIVELNHTTFGDNKWELTDFPMEFSKKDAEKIKKAFPDSKIWRKDEWYKEQIRFAQDVIEKMSNC